MPDVVPDLYPGEPIWVRLANTVWADQHGVHDALATVDQLRTWARQCGLRGVADARAADLERARELRDALRRLAADVVADDRPAAVQGSPSATQAVAVVDRLLDGCSPHLTHRPDGLAWEWRTAAGGLEGELARIALDAARFLGGAEAATLRACHGPGCVLYFAKDHPRREWCSAGCGNRARVARHYRRSKQRR